MKKDTLIIEKTKLVGIDLAKNVFQLHGVDEVGKVTFKRRIGRSELLAFVSKQIPICTIVTEACSGSSYWAREFIKLGHEAKLISPQFVKPFVKTNKTDAHDAEAITIAAKQSDMKFMPINSEEEQDIQAIHRMRERLVGGRTALVNQARGLLSEYGIIAPQGIAKIRILLATLIGNTGNDLKKIDKNEGENNLKITDIMKALCDEISDELIAIDERIKKCDIKIQAIASTNPTCQRLLTAPGVGPLTATILLTVLSNPALFKNGRHFAAFLGLVPKQYSSGEKQRLLSISKRGDKYIRSLLVHGARSVLLNASKKKDDRSEWIKKLHERRGHNCTCVAIANKNARLLWALAMNAAEYQVNYKKAA